MSSDAVHLTGHFEKSKVIVAIQGSYQVQSFIKPALPIYNDSQGYCERISMESMDTMTIQGWTTYWYIELEGTLCQSIRGIRGYCDNPKMSYVSTGT